MSDVVDRARALRQIIETNAETMTDTDALKAIELFKHWDGNGHRYEMGERFQYDNRLYKTRQEHTSQPQYTPDITPALCEEVAEEGKGTKDNPIPYNNNMKLEEGKYYIQYDVEYYCFRSTGVAVYSDLSALVEHYVRVVVDEETD